MIEVVRSLKTPEIIRELHTVSDVDRSRQAQHHTLGNGINQAAAGNHKHARILDTAVITANTTQNIVGGLVTLTGQVSRNNGAAAADNLSTLFTSLPGSIYRITAVIELFTSVAGDVVRGFVSLITGVGTLTVSPQPAWTLPAINRGDSRTIVVYYYAASVKEAVRIDAAAARVAGTGNINSTAGSLISAEQVA